MEILEAILLGIVQGATEFLPISSSAHLLIVPALFGLSSPSLNVISIAHLGTLLAVLIYFWRDLWLVTAAVLRGLANRRPLAEPDARLGWFIAVGSIPAGLAGLALEDSFDALFGHPATAAYFLLGTAALLFLGERLLSGMKDVAEMNWIDAIFIGLAQMVALLPGISRSGSTITAGLVRGLDRPAAARFSFLLGVPAILGAGLLSILEFSAAPALLAQQAPALLATFAASAIVGYACIHFLLLWLRQRNLYIFVIYCVVLSASFLAWTAVR